MLTGIDFNDPNRLGDTKNRDQVLGQLVQHFSKLRLRNADLSAPDMFGRAHEYLLEKFAGYAGKKGGELYTPNTVARLIVELLDPRDGMRICDPTCGSGGMLVECAKHVQRRGGDPQNLTLHGQEKNVGTWAICKMNMLLHGLLSARVEKGDTIRDPKLLEGGELVLYDRVIANPPFLLREWGRDVAERDRFGRFRFGLPPKHKGDLAFMQHMIATVKEGGKVGVVMPHGMLFRGGAEERIREAMLREDLFEAVVGLPPHLFYGTGISVVVLVLARGKEETRRGKVLFVDASRGFRKRRNQNHLREEDLERIVKAVAGFGDVEHYARVVEVGEIEKNDWNLNISRYVDTSSLVSTVPIPRASSTSAPSEQDVIDTLAETCDKDMAFVLLSRIEYPRGLAPQFGKGLVFWAEVVSSLPDAIGEHGLRALVEAAAGLFQGNRVFKAYLASCDALGGEPLRLARAREYADTDVTSSEPTASRGPEGEVLGEARAQWRREVLAKLTRIIEATPELPACLGRVSAWEAAALEGGAALAAAVMTTTSPYELVRFLYGAMTWLESTPEGTRLADALRLVLGLALPVVGGPCVELFHESKHVWVMNVAFDWMVEFRLAYDDRRAVASPEWRSRDGLPPPSAFVPCHHDGAPEGGASADVRVRDAARSLVERSDSIARAGRLRAMATHIIVHNDARGGAGVVGDYMIEHAKMIVEEAAEAAGREPPRTFYTVLDGKTEGEGLSVIAELIDTRLGVRVIVPRMRQEDRSSESRFRISLSKLFRRYLEINGATPA